MIITWDERKRLSNRDKHGLDFAALNVEFFERARIGPAKKKRLYAIGKLGGGVVVVFFAPIGTEAIAVVSMRAASKKERASVR